MNKLAFTLLAGSALLVQSAFGQSIGVSFVSDTNKYVSSGIADNNGDSMLASDVAGAPPYVQTNWNNFGSHGSGTFTLTNSAGGTVSLVAAWDSGGSDSIGTAGGLGTDDGKLMDGFLFSWGPGDGSTPRDPLASSVSGSQIGDKPIVYLRGLNAWLNSIPNAEGYGIVVYGSGYPNNQIGEYWLESVSGDPLANTMVSGSDLSPHYFTHNHDIFLGTYSNIISTDINNPTFNGNYAVFQGLTNDAILIRVYTPAGYTAGLNAFQIVPIFATSPTTTTPTFSPSDTVFAFQNVTVSEAATGDPFHPALFYQWLKDNGDGVATNVIQNATNSTLNVVPTNSANPYVINYAVIVSNSFGVQTSAVATLNVSPAVAPFVTQDTTPGPGNNAANVFAYAGGSVSFTAAFGGSPATYLWQSNNVNIPGATNTTLTLNNLQIADSASYQLTATNGVGGLSSTPAALTVLPALDAPTAVSSPYAFDVYTNGPVAYWRFAETADPLGNSIQAYDYSGHNFHATYGNGVMDNQPGPQSPTFAGFESTNTAVTLFNNMANSSVIAPSLNLNTNAVTITAWINPSTESAFNGILTWVNGSDKAGFGFGGTVNGSSMAELGYVWSTNNPATYNFHSGLFPLANQWSFVALTITPTNSTLYLYYVDGGTGATNLLKSVQTINNLVEPFSGGTTWIGSDTSAGRNFNGSLDEVAVFNKTLSEAQLQDLFLKGIGAAGVAPNVTDSTVYPATSVYSGQNVRLTAQVNATVPFSMNWQSSPDGTTWTDIPGETNSTVLVNPLTVGTVNYRLRALNQVGSGANNPVAITFNALPPTPPGLWTVNFQITNNVLNFTSSSSGLGHYTGRGILGAGNYWNVLPNTAGAFVGQNNLTSVSDLQDNGSTHSGISLSLAFVGGFSSATAPQPDSSDVGNLLNQMVQCWTATNELQFHNVPDGTYNLCFYGCDGTFADRGTTFVVHDPQNGDQTAGTVNASPIVPLQQGNNFVVFTNVHVSGGTLSVDVLPTPVVPKYDPNTEADFNGAQIQLVSLDSPPVFLTNSVSGGNLTLNWSQGTLQTATNLLGPWTDIASPPPVSVGTTNKEQFFRVKVR